MKATTELEIAGWREPEKTALGVRRVYAVPPGTYYDEAWEPLTPLLPAQERIRALEARLEELRPVVRAALQYKHQEPFFEPVQALSPATREWAEGEET